MARKSDERKPRLKSANGALRTVILTTPMIHVVDDDASIRKSLSRLIKAAGFNVRCYSSAMEFLTEPPVEKGACLVLDISMPGMSGLELVSHLEASGSELPVILITAHEDRYDKFTKSPNAIACLYKPLHEKELMMMIEKGMSKWKNLS